MTRRGATLFALMAVVWGVPYLLIKVAVRHLAPSVIVEGRTLVGTVALLPLALCEGQLRPLLRAWRPLLVYTAAELGVTWWLLSNAERRLPSSLTGLLIATVPLISTLLAAAVHHGEPLGARGLAGLVVGLVGVGVLLGLDIGSGDLGSVGDVGLVAIGYAVGPLVASRYLGDFSSLALATASLGLVAAAYLPAAIVQHPASVPPATVIVSVVALGLVCTALAFVAFFELIKEIGSTRATVITYLNPAVAIVLGVSLLGERVTAATAVGFVLILAGSRLATNSAAPADEPSPAQEGPRPGTDTS